MSRGQAFLFVRTYSVVVSYNLYVGLVVKSNQRNFDCNENLNNSSFLFISFLNIVDLAATVAFFATGCYKKTKRHS